MLMKKKPPTPGTRPTDFMITIDTEFSIGGYFLDPRNRPIDEDHHIYCKIGGRDFGIGLIMDILEERGFKGVFFLETEARHYFGDGVLKGIVDFIIRRGHEIQLHLHPVYRSFIGDRNPKSHVSDHMDEYPLLEQERLIREGKRFLEDSGSNPITAYRSGSYSSNRDTIEACRRNGIRYLSNYNRSMQNCKYAEDYPGRLHPFPLAGGLLEFPITNYQETGGRKEWNPFQICAASTQEMRKASDWYQGQGSSCLTFITHSFEFVRTKDMRFENLKPNNLHIRRLRDLCAFFAAHPDRFRNATYGSLEQAYGDHVESGMAAYRSPLGDVAMRYFQNLTAGS
jgi:hypothetical protein